MENIGSVHVEVQPRVSDEALDALSRQIEEAVRAGVEAGLRARTP